MTKLSACAYALVLSMVATPAFSVPPAGGFELELGVGQTLASPVPSVIPKAFVTRVSAAGSFGLGPVEVVGALSFSNSGQYAEQQPGFWAGFSGQLDSGGLIADISPAAVRIGRFTHDDEVHSPYSLFASSQPLSIPLAELELESDRFFYMTRWLALNRSSRVDGIDDRGANLRFYGARFGDFRVGFQDVAVYTDRLFDLEYLVSPVPMFFLQYLKVGRGSPWSEFGNDNSIIGFFGDFARGPGYAYSQILVDDINANSVLDPDNPYQNPSKIAWSLGGSYDTPIGNFGFYHAGATKYTFQAVGYGTVGNASDSKYGYTYYPAVEYSVSTSSGTESRIILPEDNYIGYLHGENNLAFQVTYDPQLPALDLTGAVEYTLSGSKSPANPWHELNFFSELPDGGPGTRLLDDEQLESRFELRVGGALELGRWELSAAASAGVVFNELVLVDVPAIYTGPNNEIPYFSPEPSPARAYGGISIGAVVKLGL